MNQSESNSATFDFEPSVQADGSSNKLTENIYRATYLFNRIYQGLNYTSGSTRVKTATALTVALLKNYRGEGEELYRDNEVGG